MSATTCRSNDIPTSHRSFVGFTLEVVSAASPAGRARTPDANDETSPRGAASISRRMANGHALRLGSCSV